MIGHRKSATHLGYSWVYGCGWTWRGRFICRFCREPWKGQS